MKKFYYLFFAACFTVLASCSDSEKDDYLDITYARADMVDMHVQGNKVISIVTDEDEKLRIPEDMTVGDKFARPDTTYRVALTYNYPPEKPLTMLNGIFVPVISPVASDKAITGYIDPVNLNSMWLSKNNKYINLDLGLLCGADGSGAQKLDVTLDSLVMGSDGIQRRYLTLRHDQRGQSQYYTDRVYLSIPTAACDRGDSILFNIRTYSSLKTYGFRLK